MNHSAHLRMTFGIVSELIDLSIKSMALITWQSGPQVVKDLQVRNKTLVGFKDTQA